MTRGDTIRTRINFRRHQEPSCSVLVLRVLCSLVDMEADGLSTWAFWKGGHVNAGVASLWQAFAAGGWAVSSGAMVSIQANS